MSEYYANAAQVLAVVLLALVWESKYFDNLDKRAFKGKWYKWNPRKVRIYSTSAALVVIAGMAVSLIILAGWLTNNTAWRIFVGAGLVLALGSLLFRMVSHIMGRDKIAQNSAAQALPMTQPGGSSGKVGLNTPSTSVRPQRDLLQTVIALAVLGALVLAGVSIVQTERENARRDDLTAQWQITDRYSAAVNQIGSATLDVRLGGIYALERIMHDSPADQPTIVEVLSAFIRDHPPGVAKLAPRPEPSGALPPPTDVAAALTVLGRRTVAHDGASVEDLRNTNFAATNLAGFALSGVDLTGAHLDGADLTSATLTNATFIGADLRNTDLSNADLSGLRLDGAYLDGSYLDNADLDGAHLTDADLIFADLDGADLTGAYLGGADLSDATLARAHLNRAHLNGAHLVFAELSSADLSNADLSDADLSHADLAGADLSGTSLCAGTVPSSPKLGYRCTP